MAIAFRAAATGVKAGGTGSSVTVNVPTGTVDGDVMVAFIENASSANGPGAVTGWTQLDNETTGPSVQTYYRVASSEPASYSFPCLTAQGSVGIIVSYSGVDNTTPVNAHGAFHRSTSTSTITADSITTTVSGCMLLFCGACGNAVSITGPTGYTQRANPTQSGLMSEIAEFLQSSAGATGSTTATGSISTNTDGSLIALKPAAGGSAPSNTVAPAVTGTATVGSALSTTNGTWTDDGSPTFTYQWQRDVAGNGVFSNISSATSSTYTLVEADDGNKVRCQVKDTDSNGNTTANSNAVGLITEAAAPTNSVAPVVSGTTTVGQSLSTTNGTWTAMGGSVATFAYQWQRDNTGGGVYSNIASATSSSYTLVDADDACHIRCQVTATNDVGASSPANSNAVGTVVEPVPTNSVAPVASGTAQVNVTVSASTGTWTHQGGTVATYAYQWQDSADGSTGWANVTGATASTYTIASGELNKFLRCNVTATNTGGTSSATSSNTLGPVAAAAASTSNLALFSSAGRFLKMKGLR